jgi:hypothetical protein
MARRLGRASEVLLILAGSEAAEDVADDLASLIGQSEQETPTEGPIQTGRR